MGNRAVITTKEGWAHRTTQIGVYLHWNGGRDSVEGFLKYCELKGYTSPEKDSYGWARLTQVIGNFFGGGDSLDINTVAHLDCDNYDNGVYIIENWQIVGREFFRGTFEQDEYDLTEMLLAIDEKQPEAEQLGEEFIKSKLTDPEDLEIGDIVFFMDFSGKINKSEIIGFGEDRFVNGTNVLGVPYADFYGFSGKRADNINNYIREPIRRLEKTWDEVEQ